MQKTINIQIDDDGRIFTDLAGFEGTLCEEATNQLMAILAKAGIDNERTDHRVKHEVELVRVDQQVRGRL